jgi:capsular polysaccharide biosynthesis protein
MDGSTMLRALRRTWWIVVLAALAAAGAALYLGSRQDLRYQSVASYVVSPHQSDATADVIESVRTLDQARARALVSTYVEMLTSTAVHDEAAAALGLGVFPEGYEVDAVVAPEAYVAELHVTGPAATDAAVLSGAIGVAASARFVGLYQIYDVVVLDPASVPTDPVNRGPVETALIGAALGLMAGLAIAVLAGAPRVRRRRRMQQRLEAYGTTDATVTAFPAERRTTRAG